jgi:serine/threonine protein kinase
MSDQSAGHDYSQEELRKMISAYLEPSRVPKSFSVFTDTSNFFGVDFDDVVILDGRPYLIRHCEREGRFTIDEQPKFWVKRAMDLTDGSKKVIKMVFHEKFTAKIGGLTFDCVRSPKKEARILDIVRGHPKFMQGFSVKDTAGNIIRIIDYIPGSTIADMVMNQAKGHEEYYYDHFPDIFNEFIELVEAIKFLHDKGEKHGDIRRDHIIYGKQDGIYRWIDFDFNYWHQENMFSYDIFGLGNVLIYLAGQGDVTSWQLSEDAPEVLEKLCEEDMNIVFRHRVANLHKVYPYITDQLAYVLERFSIGSEIIYDDTGEFLDDLYEARENLTREER